LTELQGGRIGVTSTPGKGSTFSFYLQARRAVLTDKPIENVMEAHTDKLQKVSLEAEPSGLEIGTAVENMKPPNHMHLPTKRDENFANPVVGCLKNANTLHVLIVEDNVINQRVSHKKAPFTSLGSSITNHLTVLGYGKSTPQSLLHSARRRPRR
jgi:hypothetical protein